MSGLAKLCKLYGQIDVTDAKGNKSTFIWDYKKDRPVLKSEITKGEIMESEKAKWMKK